MLHARERKTLALTVFAAACVCFAPAQIVSGVFLLLVSLALFWWDQRVTRREEASLPAPSLAREEGPSPLEGSRPPDPG